MAFWCGGDMWLFRFVSPSSVWDVERFYWKAILFGSVFIWVFGGGWCWGVGFGFALGLFGGLLGG